MPSRQSVSIKPSFKKIGTVVRTMFSFKDGTVDEKRRNRCLVALYEADQIKYYEPSDIAFVLFPTRLILESKNILESDNASRIITAAIK